VILQTRLRDLRESAKLGLREAARKLKISPGYLSRIEGRGEIPTPDLLCKMAELYGCEIAELLKLAKAAQLKAVEEQIELKQSEALKLFRRSKKHDGRKFL
jgi:transcriptional regulator with XRE-family HTH domain